MTTEAALAPLVGAHVPVPCLDGMERPYRDLDCAASTPALAVVAEQVDAFVPWYSSVHRGAGYKSRRATAAYEEARASVHRFAAAPEPVATTSSCSSATPPRRSTTWPTACGSAPDDVVVTTVVEHHANLLPWARVATRRWVECGRDGTFGTDDVVAGARRRAADRRCWR